MVVVVGVYSTMFISISSHVISFYITDLEEQSYTDNLFSNITKITQIYKCWIEYFDVLSGGHNLDNIRYNEETALIADTKTSIQESQKIVVKDWLLVYVF